MPRHVLRSALALAALVLASCATPPSQQDQVTLKIAVADNFAPVLRQLAQEYTAQQPWVKIEMHSANTAKLEQEIKDGAAFDLYIPARAQSVTAMADHDAILPKSRMLLALNQLMVVGPADSTLSLDLNAVLSPEVRQIAVVDPNSHLLGYLTRQALTNMRLLPSREAKPLVGNAAAANPAPEPATGAPNLEPKLLVVPDEAAVLTAVEDGRAQIGITYSTYAAADRKVRVLSPLPSATYEPIAYTTGIPRNAPHYDEAWRFLNFLRSAQAHGIMQRSGLLN